MFLVEAVVRLVGFTPPLADEQITDLIESIVEALEPHGVEPSVGSTRDDDGANLTLTIGVVADGSNQFEALQAGAGIIGGALLSAGLHLDGLDQSVQSSVRTLQPV